MVLNEIERLAGKLHNAAYSIITRNRRLSFILATLATILTASAFSYFSRNGFNPLQVTGISIFSALIYSNLMSANKNYKKAITYVFLISISFQLYLGWQFIGVEHDINNQMNAAIAIRDGKNIYTEVHPFYPEVPIHSGAEPLYSPEGLEGVKLGGDYYASPMWAYISFMILQLSLVFSANFSTLVHLPMIAATFAIGLLIYFIMKRRNRSDKESYASISSYLFNPVVIMVSGFHGQVDNLGIVFLLLYFYLILNAQKINVFHNLVLAMSLVVKLVAAPVMPFLVAKQKKFFRMILFVFVVSLPYLILVLTYPVANIATKLKAILPYGGVKYLWGYSRIENYLTTTFGLEAMHQNLSYVYIAITIALFGSMFFYFLRNKNIDYLDGIILSNLFFFAFSSGFGIQYFLWVLPFMALKTNDGKFRHFYYLFIIWSSLMALFFYYGNANVYYFMRDVIGYSLIGIPLWIFMVLWWAWYIKIGVNVKKNSSIL